MLHRKRTPWDLYIDERKGHESRYLGVLIVPNSPSFMHKLHRCRTCVDRSGGGTHFRAGEVHFHKPRGDLIDVALRWIDVVSDHNGVKFFRVGWPISESKESVVIRFLARFQRIKKLTPPYNVVVFLDFDSDHASSNAQNAIRETANIARCYHLDSRNNDILQCADLILGSLCRLEEDPAKPGEFESLMALRSHGERLSDSRIKRLWAVSLAKRRLELPRKFIDIQ